MNMPLDFTNLIDPIPQNLDFEVAHEPTKFRGKKYVINQNTGEYIGIVGDAFPAIGHTKFFTQVQEEILNTLEPHQTRDAKVTWKDSHNNAWALMDITLPNVKTEVTTDKHSTTIAQRIIALRGVDGSCSNQAYFGAIDFFCTNGQIRGEHDKVRRKNTSNFSMDRFIQDLRNSEHSFQNYARRLQALANKTLWSGDVKAMLEKLFKSDKRVEKMMQLYFQETSRRGHNGWALYSAFTNYATYADERNGFKLRNTGNDTASESMFKREHEVLQWTESKYFKELVA